MTPAWTPCPCCLEFWCNIHAMHAFECPCPPIEEWDGHPYSGRGEKSEKITDYPVDLMGSLGYHDHC